MFLNINSRSINNELIVSASISSTPDYVDAGTGYDSMDFIMSGNNVSLPLREFNNLIMCSKDNEYMNGYSHPIPEIERARFRSQLKWVSKYS